MLVHQRVYTGVLNIQMSACSLSIDFNANLRFDVESPWYSDHDFIKSAFHILHVKKEGVWLHLCWNLSTDPPSSQSWFE